MTSELRINTLKNRVGLGTITFTNTGPVVSGVVTATAFVGNITGNVTGNINHASNLELQTGGVTRGKIDSGGRLLLNTSTEGHGNADDLTIATAAGSLGNTGITIRSSTTGDGNIFFSDATSGDGETKGVIKYAHDDDHMQFNTAGDERLRITSTGAVLLGATVASNAEQFRIHTSDSGKAIIKLTNSTTSTGSGDGFEFGLNGNEQIEFFNKENTDMFFGTNNTERLRITSAGHIGFNRGTVDINDTQSQQAVVEPKRIVFNNDYSNNYTDASLKLYLFMYGATRQGFTSGPSYDLQYHSSGHATHAKHSFFTQNTERLRITSNGDLLLGNHGSRIFDDSSGTNVVVDIYGGTTAGKRGILALGGRTGNDNADIGTIQFLNENNANATSSSHVQSKLVASIDVKSETTNSNASANSGSHLIFSTKAQNAVLTERLRIASDGKVGIGTDDPKQTLHLLSDGNALIRLQSTDAYAGVQFIDPDTGAKPPLIYGAGDDFTIWTDWIERFRVDKDGNVGINVTNPTTALEVKGDITVYNANNQGDIFFGEYGDVADSKALIRMDQVSSTAGELQFHTENSGTLRERVKFQTDGTVIFRGSSVNTSNTEYEFLSSNISPYLRLNHTANNAGHTFIQFRAAGTSIGQIRDDGDGTITYVDNSDYRLKENVVDLTNAITRLKNLKPRRFNFKVSPSYTKDGFLAHELQEVVPEAVQGTKDEIVTETSKANNPSLSDMEVGDPVYQTVDRGRVVPLLTAALQEAIAKIETLEAKVAALEVHK